MAERIFFFYTHTQYIFALQNAKEPQATSWCGSLECLTDSMRVLLPTNFVRGSAKGVLEKVGFEAGKQVEGGVRGAAKVVGRNTM